LPEHPIGAAVVLSPDGLLVLKEQKKAAMKLAA